MRWSVIVMLSALAFSTALSQSRKKMYFDENDKPLPRADGCYYYSSIKKGKTSLGIDTLLTIYCESKLTRTIETINENGVRNGPYIKFNEQGGQIITGNFEAGKPVLLTQWYQKGRPKSVERYQEDEKYIEHYWDSLGNQLVKDGSGHCDCALSSYYDIDAAIQKGKVVNGLPDSIWVGYKKSGRFYFEENYKMGELISGLSFDDLGNMYEYTELWRRAEPVGDDKSFYNHVASVMVYPKSARRMGIEGLVFVEFIVEKDGSLSNVRCIKGIGEGCDEEAVKAVESAPNWNPSFKRGQKVRTRYVAPITFKLGN
jgi:TonB family protein